MRLRVRSMTTLKGLRPAARAARWGCEILATFTQGSSFLATLGFVAESRWDSLFHPMTHLRQPNQPVTDAAGGGQGEHPSPNNALDDRQFEGAEPLGGADAHDRGRNGVGSGHRHAQQSTDKEDGTAAGFVGG